MQGCVISCGTVVFFHKSRNLSRSLLTNNNFYCASLKLALGCYNSPNFERFCWLFLLPFNMPKEVFWIRCYNQMPAVSILFEQMALHSVILDNFDARFFLIPWSSLVNFIKIAQWKIKVILKPIITLNWLLLQKEKDAFILLRETIQTTIV